MNKQNPYPKLGQVWMCGSGYYRVVASPYEEVTDNVFLMVWNVDNKQWDEYGSYPIHVMQTETRHWRLPEFSDIEVPVPMDEIVQNEKGQFIPQEPEVIVI
jgi:hypothetical protein